MKRIRILSALLAVAVLAALAIAIVTTTSRHTVRAVYASTGCTDASLTGDYGIMWQGFDVLQHGTGAQLPWAGAGVLTSDGVGNVSVITTSSIGGKSTQDSSPSSGTYTVTSGCTGSMSFTSGPGAGENLNLVIVGGGTEAFLISTTPTQTVVFDVKKQ